MIFVDKNQDILHYSEIIHIGTSSPEEYFKYQSTLHGFETQFEVFEAKCHLSSWFIHRSFLHISSFCGIKVWWMNTNHRSRQTMWRKFIPSHFVVPSSLKTMNKQQQQQLEGWACGPIELNCWGILGKSC